MFNENTQVSGLGKGGKRNLFTIVYVFGLEFQVTVKVGGQVFADWDKLGKVKAKFQVDDVCRGEDLPLLLEKDSGLGLLRQGECSTDEK